MISSDIKEVNALKILPNTTISFGTVAAVDTPSTSVSNASDLFSSAISSNDSTPSFKIYFFREYDFMECREFHAQAYALVINWADGIECNQFKIRAHITRL